MGGSLKNVRKDCWRNPFIERIELRKSYGKLDNQSAGERFTALSMNFSSDFTPPFERKTWRIYPSVTTPYMFFFKSMEILFQNITFLLIQGPCPLSKYTLFLHRNADKHGLYFGTKLPGLLISMHRNKNCHHKSILSITIY